MRILGIETKIEMVDDNTKLSDKNVLHKGLADSMRGTIHLNSEMPQDVKESVLSHEVIHIISDNNGLELSEPQVTILSTSLFCVLKENGLNFNIKE